MHKFPNPVSEEMISCFNNITILFYDTETQSSWCCLETGTGIGKIMINQNGNTKRNLLKKNIDSTDGLHTVVSRHFKMNTLKFCNDNINKSTNDKPVFSTDAGKTACKLAASWLTPHRLSHLSHPVCSLNSITLPHWHSHWGFVELLHVSEHRITSWPGTMSILSITFK